MSYILDALKRADAERERGVVPGLYARQLAGSGTTKRSSGRKLMIVASASTLLLGALALALWLWRPASDSAPRVGSAQTVALPALMAPAVPASAPAISQAVVATAPTASAPSVPAPAIAPPTTPSSQPAAMAAPSQPPKTTASAQSARAPAVPLLAELSDDVRRQIPALNITGAVYSDNPGQRLLLVNNQVLPQGSLAAPEVTLEEIGAKSSIFNFRGSRFRLMH
ncbi:MAG: general secretion pathway protein GspB [Comamonadaceae bacterium]